MLKLILPILLAAIGTGAGVAAALALRPAPGASGQEDTRETSKSDTSHESATNEEDDSEELAREYVKLNNQFIVPIVRHDLISALIVIALSVEVGAGQKDEVYLREPKLRDSFLQVLFDHANMGGFSGEFTDTNTLATLREALRDVAQRDMGEMVSDVLIIDIARQDM